MSSQLKITGLFCKRALSKRSYSAKETRNFKEPTHCSHPISIYSSTYPSVYLCIYMYIYKFIYMYVYKYISHVTPFDQRGDNGREHCNLNHIVEQRRRDQQHCHTLPPHTRHSRLFYSHTLFDSCVCVTATHCNTRQHAATHGNTRQHTATHCNTLQHTATHCTHTATHSQELSPRLRHRNPP